MTELHAGSGEISDEVADRRGRSDQAEDPQLFPPAGVVGFGDESRVQEQEADHHLHGAVSPQCGDGVAAQRLAGLAEAGRRALAEELTGTAVIAQRGGYLALGDLHPLGDPHGEQRTGHGDRHHDVEGAGHLEQVEPPRGSRRHRATDQRAAQQPEHGQSRVHPHQVDRRRQHARGHRTT